ncbi:MerR family transcriptional regulator [Crassaminicella profunda]|uniref:MerR family transcriptional regulator n=1 Tax=Crassaminicella profunda TaxID=1286698 RepID=UPI001CA73AEB|nr:helix-turn-helix domain-containing protein [Crassaminicella profunda]QZY55174.1 helix-turn-helix domain-containing protein [Crassaminicella profunda]
MKKYFSIGETAKINNVSIQALRLYDRMGLLKPAYVDPNSNYRYYTIDQFIYLDLIRYSKYIGAPLKELNDVLHNKDVFTLLSFIKNQQQIVEKEIVRLENISKAIGKIENKIKYAIELKETNEIYFREIEKRFIVNAVLNKKDEESDIEIKLRKLDKILEENEIMFEGETGYFINLDVFLNEGDMCYKSIYSTLYMDSIKNNNIDIKEIQAGKFICIAYLNKDREMAVGRVRKYMKENNIHPIGIGVESQLFNTLEPWENEDLLYELQILVQTY